MAEVGLHAYVDEAKELVRSGAYDEAIAICRHILGKHPKCIEPYRVLAEACLEKGEHQEATDLFKRVLSADPEDFIAYVGAGIIYDQDGLLHEAIWQFERAFELTPGNAEIRRELKRLYTQRDGVEQPRLKLNRAALGRLYAKGGFYTQAIAEFREILAVDQERIDIQLALAEALWHDNRQREAAEICQDVLSKVPHCLKANLLLGEIWLNSGLEEDGMTLLRRAESLDPENLKAQELFGEASPLPAKTLTIERLEERELAELTQVAALAKEEAVPAAPEKEAEEWMQALKAPAAEIPAVEQLETIQEKPAEEAPPIIPALEAAPPEMAAPEPILKEEAVAGPVVEEIAPPEAGEAERAAVEAAMLPETATPEEIMAWLRQRQAGVIEEAPAEAVIPQPPAEERLAQPVEAVKEEKESPMIAALEKEFGALPTITLEEVSEEERAAIEAAMPPETATPEEVMAWLRQRQAGVAPAAPAVEVPEEGAAVVEVAPQVPALEEEKPEWLAGLKKAWETMPEEALPEGAAEAPLPLEPAQVEAAPEVPIPVEPTPAPVEVAAAEIVAEEAVPEAVAEVPAPVEAVEVGKVVPEQVVEEIAVPAPTVEEALVEVVAAAPAPTVDITAAIAGYLAKLEASPQDHPTRLALARAYVATGEWEKAAQQYTQLAQSAAEVRGDVIADLERSTQEHPEQWPLHQALGDAYMEAGRFEEALAKYNWLLSQS